jgi:predicted HTH transcriptional regulator
MRSNYHLLLKLPELLEDKMPVYTDTFELSEDTLKLLAGQEGRSVDFKSRPEGVRPEDFVAFANGQGGTILVGVEEQRDAEGKQSGRVVGCLVEDQIRQGFISMATSCRPAIDIQVRVENAGSGKPIFRIDILEGANKPYCTASGLYKIRADGQNVPVDPTLMRAIILEKEADQFVARFKQASEDLLQQVEDVRSDIIGQIGRVEKVAEKAIDAAQAAEKAANEAGMWAASQSD